MHTSGATMIIIIQVSSSSPPICMFYFALNFPLYVRLPHSDGAIHHHHYGIYIYIAFSLDRFKRPAPEAIYTQIANDTQAAVTHIICALRCAPQGGQRLNASGIVACATTVVVVVGHHPSCPDTDILGSFTKKNRGKKNIYCETSKENARARNAHCLHLTYM